MEQDQNTTNAMGYSKKEYDQRPLPESMLQPVNTADTTVANGSVHEDDSHHLRRNLGSRQVTMIAIGGALGTGLIIGTSCPSWPGSLFIAYTAVGFLCSLVMAALGEMAAWLPLASGFTGYAVRFVDPALGFALGWNYWFKYCISTANNLTAFALVIQFWIDPSDVNPGVFIACALVCIIAINYLGVRFFGEIEFWLSSLKIIVIIALMLLSLILALGGGPKHNRTGFQYWRNPGAFKEYLLPGPTGRFLAFWSSLTTAVFAYLGTELVGVTVGECQNPRKVIPRAIKLTFYRIFFFYVLLVLLLGMIVPDNSPELKTATLMNTSASASPFVVAIVLSGISVLPGIFNACILAFVISAANSDLYIASRTLFGLASEGEAPEIFSRTYGGVPVFSLGVSVAIALLSFLSISTSSTIIFQYFVNLSTILSLLTWISILITHIRFVDARRAQGLANTDLAYTAPFGKWGSVGALPFCILIAFFKGFNVFFGKFAYVTFITSYAAIPVFIAMAFGYKVIMKSNLVHPKTTDLFSGKQKIDEEEAEFIKKQELQQYGRIETTLRELHEKSIGALF